MGQRSDLMNFQKIQSFPWNERHAGAFPDSRLPSGRTPASAVHTADLSGTEHRCRGCGGVTCGLGYRAGAITANQALSAEAAGIEGRSAKAEAIEFLTEALAGGPTPAAEIMKMAREHGLTSKAVRSAR